MARLNGEWLIQQIGKRVVLFREGSEEEVVNYDVDDSTAMAYASQAIAETPLLDDELKAWAHFWQGYFYAHTS